MKCNYFTIEHITTLPFRLGTESIPLMDVGCYTLYRKRLSQLMEGGGHSLEIKKGHLLELKMGIYLKVKGALIKRNGAIIRSKMGNFPN